QADGAGDIRRAGLELVGQGVVGRLGERDRADHVAAALPGRHRVEQGRLAVKHADARRTVDLVSGEDVEVAIEVLDVDRQVRYRLGAVQKDGHAVAVGPGDDLANRVHRAQAVGDVQHGHQPGARTQQLLELVQQQLA